MKFVLLYPAAGQVPGAVPVLEDEKFSFALKEYLHSDIIQITL
jgi:hypothetical protein